MIEIEAKGYVRKGHFLIQDKKQFTEQVQETFPDQKVILTVRRDFELVSANLRRYYFGPLLGHLQDAFRDTGMTLTKKELDHKMRRLFLVKDEIDEDTGKITTVPRSLSKDAAEVSNDIMKQFIDQIIRFAVQHLDYGIAYPNEY